jgi:hypothetical protein
MRSQEGESLTDSLKVDERDSGRGCIRRNPSLRGGAADVPERPHLAFAPAEDEPENFRSEHNLSPTIDAYSFWALQARSWHRPPQRRQPTTRHDQAILDGLLIAGLWCSHQDRRSRGLYSVQVTACSTREK